MIVVKALLLAVLFVNVAVCGWLLGTAAAGRFVDWRRERRWRAAVDGIWMQVEEIARFAGDVQAASERPVSASILAEVVSDWCETQKAMGL